MSVLRPKVFVNDKTRPVREKIAYVHGNLNSLWHSLTLRVGCGECGAEAEQPCRSQSQDKPNAVLEGYHQTRYKDAKIKFGRKN